MNLSAQQFFQRHGLAVQIGILVVGLLGVIGFETQWGSSLRPPALAIAGQMTRVGETSLLPVFSLPAIDAGFKETVERPLFTPARRPVPLASSAVQPLMKKGQFRLAGTVINQDLPYAFLVEIATGKGVRVAQGGDILFSGISVAEIDAVRVVLKQGQETEELSLRTASSPPRQAALPPPPGAEAAAVMQRLQPAGAVVSGVPMPTANAPLGPTIPLGAIPATTVQPGSSALPGFVQGPQAPVPNAVPAKPSDAAAGAQRRRRVPNVPQQ